MSCFQVYKKVISKFFYIIYFIILIFIYGSNTKKQISNSKEDFVLLDFNSEDIKYFEIEIYNTNNDLKFKKKTDFNNNKKPLIFEIEQNISSTDAIHLTFNKNGFIKYKSVKIQQNRNLLSIGINDFEDYFLLNKNIQLEGDNLHVDLNFPGKARVIMKALTNKMVNIK